MTAPHKHLVWFATSNFELEPVLDDYISKYPTGDFQNYQVLFKTPGEADPKHTSYIILYEPNLGEKAKHPSFTEFLRSYCTVNKLAVAASLKGAALPRLDNRNPNLIGRVLDE